MKKRTKKLLLTAWWRFQAEPDQKRAIGKMAALLLLLAAGLGVFFDAPQYAGSDPLGIAVMANNLLTEGTLSPDAATARFFQNADGSYHQQMVMVEGRLEYRFPPGPVLLAVPFTAAAKLLGLDPLNRKVDRKIQRCLMFGATIIILLVLYDLAGDFLSPIASAFLSAAMFYGTLIGPTVGGAFWSLDGEIAVTAIAIRMLWRHPAKHGPFLSGLFGALLFLGFLCRPTFAPVIVCLFAYMSFRERRMLLYAAPCAAALLGLLMLVSLLHYRNYLPPYFLVSRLSIQALPAGLQGLLLSPSRNLFIFSPILLFPIIWYARIGSSSNPGLVISLLTAMLIYLLSNAAFPQWWGGYAFGPRILANLSFLGCVVAIGVAASLKEHARAWGIQGLTALLAVGLLVNLPGLLDDNTEKWNSYPDIDVYPQALFDWRFPQFLSVTSARLRAKCMVETQDLPLEKRKACPE